MRFLLVLALLMAGCVRDSLVTCSDGRSCPAGTVCAQVTSTSEALCVAPVEVESCSGSADGQPCTLRDGRDGMCTASSAGLICVPGSMDAPNPTARLTYLIAETSMSGEPATANVFAAIEPAPSIQIARLDGPWMATTYHADGTFDITPELATAAWRVSYELEGTGVPREVQWTGADGHLVVPVFGRLARNPVPGPSSEYVVTPFGSPSPHQGTRLFTTGIWTEGAVTVPIPPGPTVRIPVSAMTVRSGPAGIPDPTKGDVAIVVDFGINAACRSSTGGSSFQVQLVDGPSSPAVSPSWSNDAQQVSIQGDSTVLRVRVALASGTTTGQVSTQVHVGHAASRTMPAFTEQVLGSPLPVPMMMTLLECINPGTVLPVYSDPPAMSLFPRVGVFALTASRVVPVGGATLVGGIVAVSPITSDTLIVDARAPFATSPTLGGTDIGTVDRMTIATGTSSLELSFAGEPGLEADYFDITLYRVAGATLTAIRDYSVTERKLIVDRAVLEAGREYVFRIRSIAGAPGAVTGDWTSYAATQSMATAWTATFMPL